MTYSQSSKSNAQASKFLIVQFNFNTKIFEIKKKSSYGLEEKDDEIVFVPR